MDGYNLFRMDWQGEKGILFLEKGTQTLLLGHNGGGGEGTVTGSQGTPATLRGWSRLSWLCGAAAEGVQVVP